MLFKKTAASERRPDRAFRTSFLALVHGGPICSLPYVSGAMKVLHGMSLRQSVYCICSVFVEIDSCALVRDRRNYPGGCHRPR